MAIRIVQSKLNSRIKQLRAALRHPGRDSAGLVGLEGIHLLAEALRSGIEIETVFVAQGQEHLLKEPALAAFRLADRFDVVAVPRDVLDLAATTESPQPVAALAKTRTWEWADLLSPSVSHSPALLVVLAGIQDPGNLGTILRSAEAFGATGVVSLPGTVSQWNSKAMRASAGSVFRMPIVPESVSDCFSYLSEAGVATLAAMARDAQPLHELDLTGPAAFVIGSEGNGLAPELAARCSARITIPTPGPVESLNAAVAASVLLYEASRQRASGSYAGTPVPNPRPKANRKRHPRN
jgi:TrmH family RNA methyltransferase